MSLVPYSFSVSAGSGLWSYQPNRWTTAGWTGRYTETETPPENALGDGDFYFSTGSSNASVNITFTGTQALLCITDNGADWRVTFDDQPFEPRDVANDPACAELGASQTIAGPEADFRSHRLALQVPTAGPLRFFGGVIRTRVETTEGSDVAHPESIDDVATRWNRTGEWTIARDTRTYNGANSFTCPYGNAGAFASYSFAGASAVILWGGPWQDSHAYSVDFDGRRFNSDLSVSNWSLPPVPMFFQAGLDPTRQYTILLQNWNADRPDCVSDVREYSRYCCISYDSLQLFGANLDTSPSSSTNPTVGFGPSSTSTTTTSLPGTDQQQQNQGSSTNVGAIAGGVVGGVVIGVLLLVAFFFYWRKKQRERDELFEKASYKDDSTRYSAGAHGLPSPYPLSEPTTYFAPSTVVSDAPAPLLATGSPMHRGKGGRPMGASSPDSGAAHATRAASSGDASSGADMPLRPEDMTRVLQYVAGQIDRAPPAYQHQP